MRSIKWVNICIKKKERHKKLAFNLEVDILDQKKSSIILAT